MNEAEKTQFIRLIDVFVLAPFMIWFAIKSKGVSDIAKIMLVVAGILTITYNGKNYLINEGVIK